MQDKAKVSFFQTKNGKITLWGTVGTVTLVGVYFLLAWAIGIWPFSTYAKDLKKITESYKVGKAEEVLKSKDEANKEATKLETQSKALEDFIKRYNDKYTDKKISTTNSDDLKTKIAAFKTAIVDDAFKDGDKKNALKTAFDAIKQETIDAMMKAIVETNKEVLETK